MNDIEIVEDAKHECIDDDLPSSSNAVKKKRNKKSNKKKSKNLGNISNLVDEKGTTVDDAVLSVTADSGECHEIQASAVNENMGVIPEKFMELPDSRNFGIIFANYTDESFLCKIQDLVSKDLSEPYSVFTFRYFLQNWPKLCICAFLKAEDTNEAYGQLVGAIICKAELEQDNVMRGYIAMLAVSKDQRNKGIGSQLSHIGIRRMLAMGCDEIALETEVHS